MRVLICDDEKLAVDTTAEIVSEYFRTRNLPADITTESDSDRVIADDVSYDIALIDIEMPGKSGLDVARHLKNCNRNVIIFIVTSYPQYLDSAMDLQILRFLPKPLDKNRVFCGLDSAVKRYRDGTKILLDENGDIRRVYVSDVLYITIHRRKTLVVTKNGEYRSSKSLKKWQESLCDVCFVQPHYSYLVNMQNIERIENGMIILKKNDSENVEIKIAQKKLKEFKRIFFEYVEGDF